MTKNRGEAEVQGQLCQCVEMLGYLTYHTYDSRRCQPGFPDLWIVGFGKLLVLELKAGRNKPTVIQQRWISELNTAGVDARLYHVDEWKSRAIITELQMVKANFRRFR